jgi:hypothetical protein
VGVLDDGKGVLPWWGLRESPKVGGVSIQYWGGCNYPHRGLYKFLAMYRIKQKYAGVHCSPFRHFVRPLKWMYI